MRNTPVTRLSTALHLAGLCSVLMVPAAFAQTQPNAGSTLQQGAAALAAPAPRQSLQITAPQTAAALAGGTKVVVRGVAFAGNTVFNAKQLQEVLGDVAGKELDLAGVQALASTVSEYYRAAGYRFALAYLPPQTLTDGQLRIDIAEGQYGQVTAVMDPQVKGSVQGFLSPLKTGDVIDTAPLERVSLIVAAQPGIKVIPILRPGKAVGTGDLDMMVSKDKSIGGDVGIDNYGNRYTGQNAVRASLQINSPFMLGDQITARAMFTDESMSNGSVGYNLPLGGSGLRGSLGASHTEYTLGKDFASLKATGVADVATVGLSYPLWLREASSATLSATYQRKRLNDRQGSTNSNTTKSSDSLPLELRFDRRDAQGAGGLTYGAISWTSGKLNLDSTLSAQDKSGGKLSEGTFNKFNLDLARVHNLSQSWALFGRVSVQGADKNLDSSEGFALGGANGVRAYPTGEAQGDTGWLSQLEVRYMLGDWSPYVFYDLGISTTNAKPDTITPAVTQNQRKLSGGGLGLRYNAKGWSLDTNVAWRSEGGTPTSDTDKSEPRAWLTLTKRF